MLRALRLPACKLGLLAAFITIAMASTGCDTGGLLITEHKPQNPVGPSVNEMVSGGTYASNSKYKLFYTTGQPTPNQGVSTSPGGTQLNGGLVGAAHSD